MRQWIVTSFTALILGAHSRSGAYYCSDRLPHGALSGPGALSGQALFRAITVYLYGIVTGLFNECFLSGRNSIVFRPPHGVGEGYIWSGWGVYIEWVRGIYGVGEGYIWSGWGVYMEWVRGIYWVGEGYIWSGWGVYIAPPPFSQFVF